ncbi:MAG: ABC transporter ATP-binding protein, partial [Duncaniella sp.]|nr:ABC transporter ATP-binding protein [Duncaniella sp.]
SYMDEAARCDRLAMINGGRILATGTPATLSSRLDGQLYNAAASDMFLLLGKLRQCDGVIDCYTFGSTLHAVVAPGFDAAEVEARLRGEGLSDVRIYPATPDIEDVFIKLTYDTRH